jgi:Ca2+-binding EF-hand superfamily protein
MNKLITSLLTASLGLALTLPAYAEHGEHGKMGVHCKMHGTKTFDEADTNKDGMLNKEEALAACSRHFDKMDTNKDGSVSKEELDVCGSHKHGDKSAARHKKYDKEFKAADADKSGTISQDEAKKLPLVAKHFDVIDINKDGSLDGDELYNFMHHQPAK